MRQYTLVKHVFVIGDPVPLGTLVRNMKLPSGLFPSMVIQKGAFLDTAQLVGYAANEFEDAGVWEVLVTPVMVEDTEEAAQHTNDLLQEGWIMGEGVVRFLDVVATEDELPPMDPMCDGDCDCAHDCGEIDLTGCDGIEGIDIEGFDK
jgi:hypothetical protein